MKPDWKDAPEWANWLAMDGDGYWVWYEVMPSFEGEEWALDGEGDRYLVASDDPDYSGIDWDHAFDTLDHRP